MRLSFEHLHVSSKFSPLAFVAASLICGIAIGEWIHSPRAAAIVLIVASIGAAVLVRNRRVLFSGSALMLSFLCAGIALSVIEQNSIAQSRLKVLCETGDISSDAPSLVLGALQTEPEPGPDFSLLTIEASKIENKRRSFGVSGVIAARISLDSPEKRTEFGRLDLHRGSRVRLLTILERSSEYRNPGVSDYTEYLDRKGFDVQAWVKSPLLIENAGNRSVDLVRNGLARVRVWLERRLDEALDTRSAAVVKAVALGNKNFLDDDTISKFRAGGTFHLLVISGIHLAFLSWLAFMLLYPLARFERVRVALVIGITWLYALMVGMQPPVSRAAVMISIVVAGKLLFRKARALNTLSLAAIVLLAAKPSSLWDPGFQLSFCAAALIVFLPGPIYAMLGAIGSWRPSADAPYPPAAPRWLLRLSEALFWDERGFRKDQASSLVKYKIPKSRVALWLGRLRLQGIARIIAAAFITSALAQLGLLPLSVSYFNRIVIAGVWLNVVTSFLLGAQLAMSALTVAIHSLAPMWAHGCAALTRRLTDLTIAPVAPMMGTIFSARVPHLSGLWLLLYVPYYASFAVLVARLAKWNPLALPAVSRAEPQAFWIRAAQWPRRHTAAAAAACLAALVLFSYRPPRFDAPPHGRLRVSFLDVGQGDSALIEFPSGETMLIDGGGRPPIGGADEIGNAGRADSHVGERVVSRFLWRKGITRVDYMLATHGHADHTEGLGDVSGNFEVREAYTGPMPSNDPELHELASRLRYRHVATKVLSRGDSFAIGDVRFKVLWPPASVAAHEQSGNDDSLVLLLQFGDVRMIFTGDIESHAEGEIVSAADDLRCRLLKVAHHGSRTSSTAAFLARASPTDAVISVARDSVFGHPHQEVVERLLSAGAQLFVTGCAGAITAETDGREMWMSAFTGDPRCRGNNLRTSRVIY